MSRDERLLLAGLLVVAPEGLARSFCQATRRIATTALLCDRSRDHYGLHLDEANMLWWAGHDNRMVSNDGLVTR